MPALPSVVTNYVEALKAALRQGSDLGSNLQAGPQNFLRAQDMATILDLFQQALSQPTALTATGGTTKSVVDGASTFVANSQIGNTVVFAGNTTAALAGVEAVVVANNTTTLFFREDLPAAPEAGDEYTIVGTMFQPWVEELRDGKGLADAPRGSVYGDYRVAVAPMLVGIERLGASLAERSFATLTTTAGSTAQVLNVNPRGGAMRIDELRGKRVTVSGANRMVLTNTEDTVTLDAPLPSAPSADVTVAVSVPVDDFGGTSAPKLKVHPGEQAAENIVLADLIAQFQAAVEDFDLPE